MGFDIQDDLAATAHNEAVFFEDPSFEIEDFFSDWDELSDDFYDDDATVQRRQRVADLSIRGTNGVRQTTRRQKQKTAVTNDHDQSQPGKLNTWALDPDPASFQSVVWKHPDHDKNPVQMLQPGDGEKVALLKNWREIFKNSHPSLGLSRRRKQRVMDYLASEEAGPARSGPVNGLLEDEKNTRETSTDRASGVSLENLHETDIASGDMSNTTPEKSVSPPFVHGEKTGKPHSTNALGSDQSVTVKNSEKNGLNGTLTKNRKRKADEQPAQNGSAQEDIKQPKSKRTATRKAGEDIQPEPASAGPVRRSARQTRSQK